MSSPALTQTRESWHRLAEHVLAAGQFGAAGTIRLRPCPGGFRTVAPIDGRELAVVGDELVVLEQDQRRATPLTTIGAAASFAGVDPGLRGSYQPATSADPDAPLTVDPDAARLLAAWFALGEAALRQFTAGLGAPQEPVLWPEHFDLGVTADGVNYGCSPGDAAVTEPYLYVGPHEPPSQGAFWNAPFGAVATAEKITTPEDAVAFYGQGRALTATAR